MLRRTTSMPTPRPETSVTWAAVENPGSKINRWMSSGAGVTSAAISPLRRALSRMRSVSRPAPSSFTSMMT